MSKFSKNTCPTLESQIEHTGSLKLQAVTGLFWMISQTFLNKLVAFAGQIALAYLLLPDHFAAISLTYTVTAFARILENGGLREVLIFRSEKFDELANPAFWLSLTLGSSAGLVIVLAAPFASSVYQSTEVYWLLLCLAIQPVVVSLASVPTAELQTAHKFRFMAGVAAIQGVAQTLATVLFASIGWGAFSFVFGTLFATCLNTIAVWSVCSSKVLPKLEFAKWPDLWMGTLSLSLVGLSTALFQQLDYMMLGIFQEKIAVGYYFFAFGMASQAGHLLMRNIAKVFLPLLCKIQSDPQRQLAASLSAFQILAAVGLPLSFLQCGLIDSAFHLFLPTKWLPAIPIAQILSLGLGLNVLSSLCWSLLKAQGRFNVILGLNWAGAIPFTAAVTIAAIYGSTHTVAWVVTVWCAIYSPLVLWLSIKSLGGTWRNVLSIFGVPTSASIAALCIAWQFESFVMESKWQYLARLLTVAIAFSTIYIIGLRVGNHPLLSEIAKVVPNRIWGQTKSR